MSDGNNKKPNFLIFIIDEERYPPVYETKELRKWRAKNLRFQTELRKLGIVFHNHYVNTTACTPSRASFHTGQYPNVTGVTQTDGLAIPADSPQMTWLPKFTVPTIGNYFREAGYKTVLKGKWHVSNASIKLNDGTDLLTFDENGTPIKSREDFYLEKNVLKDFGYDGWIGNEPHGSLAQNSGSSVPPPESGRDIGYTEQVIRELDVLKDSIKPWLVIASFVNPHDVAVYGMYTNLSPNWDFPVDETLPEKLFTEEYEISHNELLRGKPFAQTYYRDLYAKIIQPIPNTDRYQRAYYTMEKKVDDDMFKVWTKFKTSPDYQNTIVLFFSDHGELLSSHGNMHQKWFNAYDESIKVPFIITSPLLGNQHQDVTELTSHIDILPTLLGLAQLNSEKIRKQLGKKFSLNLPLPGKNLTKYLTSGKFPSRPVYFYTQDNPLSGSNQFNQFCQPYQTVPEPCSVEAIIIKYQCKLWKITRYYNYKASCENTYGQGLKDNIAETQDFIGSNLESNSKITHELYNVTDDPIEVNNLYYHPKYQEIRKHLLDILNRESFLYRGGVSMFL